MWAGKTCKKEHNGCRFAHPTICSISNCNNCNNFHPAPRTAGNGKGDARKGNGVPKKSQPKRGQAPSSSGGGGGGSNSSKGRGGSGSSNHNNRNPTYAQLKERVDKMRHQLSRDEGLRKELREIKEMSFIGNMHSINSTNNNGNSPSVANGGWWARAGGRVPGVVHGERKDEDFAHAQLPPGLMDAVMTAVRAVMVEGPRGGQRHCRC